MTAAHADIFTRLDTGRPVCNVGNWTEAERRRIHQMHRDGLLEASPSQWPDARPQYRLIPEMQGRAQLMPHRAHMVRSAKIIAGYLPDATFKTVAYGKGKTRLTITGNFRKPRSYTIGETVETFEEAETLAHAVRAAANLILYAHYITIDRIHADEVPARQAERDARIALSLEDWTAYREAVAIVEAAQQKAERVPKARKPEPKQLELAL